jgi:protein subunit release factor B
MKVYDPVIVVLEKDLEESFIRSSGPGGQNVNKVSTAVFLRHIPTGVTVKCQEFRSQEQNRERARELLLLELLRRERVKQELYVHQKEKARRQRRQKPRALKKRMIEDKRLRSQKKQVRSRVSSMEE